jgi:hypothetical protein
LDWTDLENTLKNDLKKVSLLCHDWFYYNSKEKQSHEIIMENLENFSLEDAGYVHQISMSANEDYVLIETSDGRSSH